MNARKGFAENPENRGEHEGGVKVGGAEHDVAFDVRRSKLRQHLVVKSDDRSCVTQDRLAFRRQKQPAALMDEDGLSGEFLKPL